jgi:hypothetical protein
MDIEDDLDLSELLAPVPPPANGSSRARRTIRRRRVLHRTASGLALAAVTVGAVMSMNASRDPSDDDVLAGRPAEAALLAVSRTDRGDEDFEFRVRVIDVATGKSRVLNTVSPEPIGEARLLSREGATTCSYFGPPSLEGRVISPQDSA